MRKVQAMEPMWAQAALSLVLSRPDGARSSRSFEAQVDKKNFHQFKLKLSQGEGNG